MTKRFFLWLGKAAAAGLLAFLLLCLFCLFYSNIPVHYANPTGATEYRWEAGRFYSRMTEGFALGRINSDGFNNLLDYTPGETIDDNISRMFEAMPELSQATTKENLTEQLMETISEEMLLSDFDVLALNGKTIANGRQDTYTNSDGMKMKRMYFIAGKKIISNATLDMSKDELKEFIIKQVEKEAPEQAQMIKENIDMVMGQLKFDATEKNTYEMQDNNWPASIISEETKDSMGQSVKVTSTTSLKK